jgi:hypothetical protein
MQKPDEFVALLDPELAISQFAAHLAKRNDKHPRDYESSIWREMCSAIRQGELPIRAFPLWNKVAPDKAFREDGGLYGYSEKGYALAVADLHRWMVDGGMPTPADAKGLWEILQQEDPTPETQPGRQDAPVNDVRYPGRPPSTLKQQAYVHYGDVWRQIEVARELQAQGVEINQDSMIKELMRLSEVTFPGSATSATVWKKAENFTITPIQKALGLRQKRQSTRMKKPVNVERSAIGNLFQK